ncbi:hypothetical protein HNP11_003454 [Tsukamurella ocularis]|nr:hypothetical protein [Tsukamurella ocularis]MCS3789262.1 hypothetical protein [Tsukamurella ocularis]MCS3853112.1 hypothetical protein [Tsukamurella ocularis]
MHGRAEVDGRLWLAWDYAAAFVSFSFFRDPRCGPGQTKATTSSAQPQLRVTPAPPWP